jgi:hypothetical protein
MTKEQEEKHFVLVSAGYAPQPWPMVALQAAW